MGGVISGPWNYPNDELDIKRGWFLQGWVRRGERRLQGRIGFRPLSDPSNGRT